MDDGQGAELIGLEWNGCAGQVFVQFFTFLLKNKISKNETTYQYPDVLVVRTFFFKIIF